MVKKRNYINSQRSDPASRFDKRLILQIVKEVEDGLPRKQVCAKYGMAYCTINEWMRKFASQSYRATMRASFSSQHRRNIVRQVLEEKITKQQARQLYKVSSKTLNTWLLNAKKEESELVSYNQHDMAANQNDPIQVNLHKQLSDATLKIKALQTMIDIAEDQFKIAIRKKSGAKQLKE